MTLLDQLILSLAIALKNTSVHVALWDGMMLSRVREVIASALDRLVGKKWSRYIQKPLWDCLPCMASIWTIAWTLSVNVQLILLVCGVSVLIDCILPHSNFHPDAGVKE